MQREAPRRREGLGALVEEAALHQRIGDELPQILGRTPLHARGDFFGEEFEEKVGHARGNSGPVGPRRDGSLWNRPPSFRGTDKRTRNHL
ncbi:hypothetical protein JCM2811A_46440 [Methylorubrum rhodinum]